MNQNGVGFHIDICLFFLVKDENWMENLLTREVKDENFWGISILGPTGLICCKSFGPF